MVIYVYSMEKLIIKETLKRAKPEITKKKVYKPRKKKDESSEIEEFVMRANEIPNIKVPKQAGSYKIGKSFHIFFETKPNVIHRFFTKLFFGWKWHDQK
jgi:hypothetical protein